MARITPDTFDPLRSYISVRLLQGVPLVDADWNEAHDVRKFEVQAFLKWFVGNGVPEGNDGFRIAGLTSVRVKEDDPPVWDFVIQCRVDPAPADTSHVEQGLRHVGRCLVDGMDVLIAADINFRAQKLHVSQGGAAAQARLLGVPTIAEIPVSDDPVVVYLDVWERLVTPDDEPGLMHRGLGVESCARLKREWVVRARAGSVPMPNDPNDLDDSIRFIAGHSYYALATIAHKVVTDQRERRLLMPPATLIEDLFGLGPMDYRRGQGRPRVNLREAINALLRGELPSSTETPITPALGSSPIHLLRVAFFNAERGLIITSNERKLFAAQLSLAMPNIGLGAAEQIEDHDFVINPRSLLLDTGEVLIVYNVVGRPGPIALKRGTLATLRGSPEKTVTAQDDDMTQGPWAVVAVGGQVLIFWEAAHPDHPGPPFIRFKRYNVTAPPPDSFGPEEWLSSDDPLINGTVHAAGDSMDMVWAAFPDYSNGKTIMNMVRIPFGEAPHTPEQLSVFGDGGDVIPQVQPFVLVDHDDNVWVFWSVNPYNGVSTGIWSRRFLRATGKWESPDGTGPVPGTAEGTRNDSLYAVSDPEGGIWLFWVSNRRGNMNWWYVRQNSVTQAWSEPRQIPSRRLDIDHSHVFLWGPDGTLWHFWVRKFEDNSERLFYRRIFPSI